MTHALFYLNSEYKNQVINAIQKTHNANRKRLDNRAKLVECMTDILFKMGYAKSSIVDEINAYMTTGDKKYFNKLDKVAYASLKKELCMLHKKYYPEFVKDIK